MSDSAILWTVASQAPLSMGYSRQEYWSGLPCPPGDLSNPGIEPALPHCRQVLYCLGSVKLVREKLKLKILVPVAAYVSVQYENGKESFILWY